MAAHCSIITIMLFEVSCNLSCLPLSEVATNAKPLKANIPEEGAVLKGKIKGVKVYKSADKKSQILYTLKKNEEVVFGDHSAGYYFIVGEDGRGWVLQFSQIIRFLESMDFN